MTNNENKISMMDFPINPFEDVMPTEFNKLNKKHVTEDFVEENFKNMGWDVFKPFHDTGIDRIVNKVVCPNGHTKINENLRNKKCQICKSEGIEITRFLQVKTRQLKKNVFGFTLKSKDIRIDPRHVYLLYSDNTSASKQDFLILPVKEYLLFFKNNSMNPFAPTSFRKGNNKLNSLKYNSETDEWKWGRHSWEHFRNLDGLKLIQSPSIDINLKKEITETREIADSLQRVFSRGSSYTEEVGETINNELKVKLKLYSSNDSILKLRNDIEKYLKEECSEETFASMKKYFEFIKTLETLGGEEGSKESKNKLKEIEGEDTDD